MNLRSSNGFTLIELISATAVISAVTLILMASYNFADKQYRRNVKYSGLQYYSIYLVRSIEKNLLSSKGIVSGSLDKLVFQKSSGRIAYYKFDNGELFYKNKKLGMGKYRFSDFTLEYFGKTLSGNTGLDDFVGFTDMDINGDGSIAGSEVAMVKMVKIGFAVVSHKDSVFYEIQIKIRGKTDLTR